MAIVELEYAMGKMPIPMPTIAAKGPFMLSTQPATGSFKALITKSIMNI